ncbi:MAG: TM2 domain-containing protein [Clostridia bacterium]|nr:TM2 domain-containing protein [Clostridia bacterium]
MDQHKIQTYLITNAKYFLPEHRSMIKSALECASDSAFDALNLIDLKDPTVYTILSIFLGGYGVDRFMLGDVGMGVLKLLTGGVCGILWLYDIFTIQKRAMEENFNAVMEVIS